ncbi:MAG: nucleotidyltransferase family protein [Acidobacteriota bacterium]|nr:nucleotidyltransferase family protein [Acidobacteriota bacterium]
MSATDFQEILSSPTLTYQEGLAFFMGTGLLNNTLRRVTSDLERLGISHSVIGAVALNQHGYRRFTEDIDLLLTKEGLKEFQDKLVGLGYRPAFEGATRRFRTTQENVTIEIITAGEYPGDGLPKPVVFPNPEGNYVVIDGIKTITLEKLVELKLASGMTALDRLKDLADVQELIKVKDLAADFAQQLDSSVRDRFIELYQAVAQAKERERGTLTE